MVHVKDEITQNNHWKISKISNEVPSYRDSVLKNNGSWLKGKRNDDNAEGLWRIHDNLYDFTDFIDKHPGGAFWLQTTKGTDITEAFESHHISSFPEKLIEHFKVREASKPRIYKFTFKDDGFYKILKSRVRERLKEINYKPTMKTDMIHISLILATFGLSVFSCLLDSKLVATLASISLCLLTNCSHNYFHQKDSWKMYAFNFSMLNFNSWRVSHCISHHGYPNSLYDLEMSSFEPFLIWVPNPYIASKFKRIVALISQPIFYVIIFPFGLIARAMEGLVYENVLYWHDILAFALPTFMYLGTGLPLGVVLKYWIIIILLGGLFFGIVGANAAHHSPEIVHDGDAIRDDMDWGIYQIDTTIDRNDTKGSDFLVLTHYGEHTLHHLFPTIDHSVLPMLYPQLKQTLEEFNIDFRESNGWQHIIGQGKQVLRTNPNPVKPGQEKQKPKKN